MQINSHNAQNDIHFMVFMYSRHKVKQLLPLSKMKLHYLNEMHFTERRRMSLSQVEALLANFYKRIPKIIS